MISYSFFGHDFSNIHRLLYLALKRAKPALALVGFILMHAALTNSFSTTSVVIALSLGLAYLFGDMYNDYWDVEEDIRNERKEKLTVAGILTREQMKKASFMVLGAGLVLGLLIDFSVFFIGLLLGVLLIAYSHPAIRLKKYNVVGYALLGVPFFMMPFAVEQHFSIDFNLNTYFFGLFFFSQYTYILCQKDSTDLRDDVGTNLFLKKGWSNATLITALFALLSSVFMFLVSMSSIILSIIAVLNFIFLKLGNIYLIFTKSINRKLRFKITTLDFVTPFLMFVIGLL